MAEATPNGGISGLRPSALKVLARIAFRQPISQAEIDRLFDADKHDSS
jgi:chromosome segregation and condensation protein ScpB